MNKFWLIIFLTFLTFYSYSQSTALKEVTPYVDAIYPSLDELYKHLHQNPELSLQEEKTAQNMASGLRKAGFDVIENIGGYGVAGIFKNGNGPTLLIRTDMDALPLEEKTGLPYASNAKSINAAGNEVNIMHACGHDIHMTVFIGTARALVQHKNKWKGTLVMVAQPAEENGLGADKMFKDGLYQKIPTPDYAIALHDNAFLPAGKMGFREGPFMASVDMVDLTVYGEGGHGAAPHTTIDPVVLSAQMVLAFQTIVSREINPIDPAVVTVGSIHGGTVHNIIPDEVKLQLTLRSYSRKVRDQSIAALHRISRNIALSANLPENRLPVISIREPSTPATVNDLELTQRLVGLFRKDFGAENVVEMPPYMVGEDFSRYGMQEEKVPIFMFWLGAIDPEKVKQAEQSGEQLPSLHSPYFAPLPEPTIKTGVKAMYSAALELFKK
jgi:hippurate hydrolase